MNGCPHCENFEKTKVLSKLKKKGIPIVKTEQSNAPPEISAFPTIVYNEYHYSGERTLQSILQWIKEHKFHKNNSSNKKKNTRSKQNKTKKNYKQLFKVSI